MDEIEQNEEMELEQENFEDQSDDSFESTMSGPFDPTEIQIQSKPDTLRNIIERLKHNEIDMNTNFQRHPDLWSPAKMSRLIESILIRFPLPAFYFDASNDDNWLIVDGLQRLSSIRKFVIDKKLKLSGLEYLNKLKGKGYDELPRQYRRRIDECPITMFQIMPGTPIDVKYSVFRRINTGGLVLNNQEIRNAMSKQPERDFLQKLTENEYLKNSIGDQSRRMADQELVLRFIAFYNHDFVTSKKSIASFLDDAMAYIAISNDEVLNSIENVYNEAIKTCYEIFDRYAFEKHSPADNSKRKRKSATLFEVWMVSIAKLKHTERKLLVERNTKVREKFAEIITKEAFSRSISFATQKHDHVIIRYENFKTLLEAEFPLTSLNIFSGLNGMGKSSLIQTLLLLRQSFERNTLQDKGLLLNGDYVNLGMGADVLSADSENSQIKFLIKWQKESGREYLFQEAPESDLLPLVTSINFKSPNKKSLFNRNFQYLSAD